MKMFKPLDRKELLMLVDTYIQQKYGTYKELISLTLRDLVEIGIAIESKEQEQQIAEAL